MECGGIIGRSLNAHIKVVSSGDILGWEGTAWNKASWENLLAYYITWGRKIVLEHFGKEISNKLVSSFFLPLY